LDKLVCERRDRGIALEDLGARDRAVTESAYWLFGGDEGLAEGREENQGQ